MLAIFKNHLENNFSFIKNKSLFLAISGGIDSMVMLHLFQQFDYKFAILHSNFQLRNKESDADLAFIQDYADKFNIPWSFGHFQTKAYSKEQKISIQMAARTLRYEWFEEQLQEKKFDYVLTAHQADDVLETFIINFSRGTGLDGLIGIPQSNEKIIRPLLPFSRQEIEEYAKLNNVKWREDSSNETDKYLRNNIRHNITPLLKELNPSFLNSFQSTINNLKQAQSLVQDATIIIYQSIVSDEDDVKKFNISELVRLPNYKAYLYQWLNPFGFSDWDAIYDLVDAQSGKQIFSDHFRLLKDRNQLLLTPKNKVATPTSYLIEANKRQITKPIKLSFTPVKKVAKTSSYTIFVDANKLQYPLELRIWEEGDSFQPFGMDGNTKKISKFLKDIKLNLFEKEKIWLLCSDNQVVWIVGWQADDRFKTDETTNQILQIKFL